MHYQKVKHIPTLGKVVKDGKIFLRCEQLDWQGQRFGGKSLPLPCKETVVKAFQNVEPKGGGTIQ